MQEEVKMIVTAVNELTRQMSKDRDRIYDLEEALTEFVKEKCDYMQINNLGDPEKTHVIKMARKALKEKE